MLLAHSKPEQNRPAQGYKEHVENVIQLVVRFTSELDAVAPGFKVLWDSVFAAAAVHDCGKLAPENQHVLSGDNKAERLPIPHEDAGVLWLLRLKAAFAALLVYSHHRGLPSIQAERIKPFTDAAVAALRDPRVAKRMDEELICYQQIYSELGIALRPPHASKMHDYRGTAARIALSCLTDADHTDTANAAGTLRPDARVSCRWQERLEQLNKYVGGLSARDKSPRHDEREQLYGFCSGSELHTLATLESPVGSGKTLAAMAYLLRAAIAHGLRHIFVVLPYTSIIDQNVRVYRDALTLQGEHPEDVVSAVHHKAEFQDWTARILASHWDSPIIVTTSVQFFEILASNRPGALRRLHQLPGSAIFLDEAHTCLPTHLWRQSWEWIKELISGWNCHFLLGSGSLPRLWEVKNLLESSAPVPSILANDFRAKIFRRESGRVRLQVHESNLSLPGIASFVMEKPGPRLCILNTVNNAATLARYLQDKDVDTLHLSTALCPRDREVIMRRIEDKLRTESDGNWVLVATSCVEAGMDFSFRTGIREAASLNSLIQTGGRVNRNSESNIAEVFSVRLADNLFNRNPQLNASRQVLGACLMEEPEWADLPGLVTDAVAREFSLSPATEQRAAELRKLERTLDYPGVAEHYKVIEAATLTVIVDPNIANRLKAGDPVSWRTIQMGSVQMWASRADRLGVEPLLGREEEGLYEWCRAYDPDFLGYMAGVLDGAPKSRGQPCDVNS